MSNMKKFLSSTNGWQRIYLLIAIVSLPFFFIFGVEPTLTSDIKIDANREIYATKMKEFLKEKSNKLSTSSIYTMPDGMQFNTAYPMEDVEKAYEITKKNLEQFDSIKKYKHNLLQFSLYLLIMSIIYFLGWFVSWIIKGFKSPPT